MSTKSLGEYLFVWLSIFISIKRCISDESVYEYGTCNETFHIFGQNDDEIEHWNINIDKIID